MIAIALDTVSTTEANDCVGALATRVGCVHGATTLKKTGRPRYDAASTRSVALPRSGNGPSQRTMNYRLCVCA